MTDEERLETAVIAALLAGGRSLDWLGSALTVAAAVLLLAGLDARELALAIVLVGIAGKYLATRVAFDALLFAVAAERALATEPFDAAMTHLGLMVPGKTGRPWIERCRGARRLLRLQAAAVALQCALAAAAGIAS
jgi:hypothetical protein